jgi:Macrocin-O-methyltransferase (TylF)
MEQKIVADPLVKLSGEFTMRSNAEQMSVERLYEIQMEMLPRLNQGPQWNLHQTVFLRRQSLSRLIYYYELYQKIIDVPGVICEFGVQWGATLSTLINLRGMFEPFNHSRTIYGFDTFEGFVQIDEKDGGFSAAGDYSTTANYYEVLEEILHLQESFSPIPHMKKFELVRGDASHTVPEWLERNPHAIVAMAILDMDVYRPTRDVLTKLIPRLTKGSLLVFDELNCRHFPGETEALAEVIGLNNLKLHRFPHQPFCAWAIYGE